MSVGGSKWETVKELKNWRRLVSTALTAAVIGFSCDVSALAELNKYEAETRGEFRIGQKLNLVLLISNADLRETDFSGSTFNGAYLEKAVAYKANFTGADLSDTLMDRMVLNEANLINTVLVRSVLTRSDLGGAIIDGADFSNAVIDLSQKQVFLEALCKYTNGMNPITGISTRKSLGCEN